MPKQISVDQRLRPENDRKGQTFGVFGVGFGGVDHDAQILDGDDQRIALQRDRPDMGWSMTLRHPESWDATAELLNSAA